MRVAPEREHLERKLAALRHRLVCLFPRLELVHDLDRLRSHAEPLHESVERGHLLRAFVRARDDVVELHAEDDFLLRREQPREAVAHRIQILLLPERLAELATHVLIDAARKSMPQQPEHRVHLLLDDLALVLREAREHLDHEREKALILRGPRASREPAPTAGEKPARRAEWRQDAFSE